MNTVTGHACQLPPEQFLWGVLEVPAAIGSRRPTRQQLAYLFEPLVPVALNQVHAVYEPLGDGRYLACGMERDLLREHINACGATLTVLTPSSLPAFIQADLDPGRLNLLTEVFEPHRVTRLRRIAFLHAAAIALICSLLVALGFELRTRHLHEQVQAAHEQRAAIFAEVLGPEALQSRQPPELQLMSQLRQLRQTRTTELHDTLADVGDSIVALLSKWPSSNDENDAALHLQTELISITPSAISIRSVLPSAGDAQQLAATLGRIDNWRLRQPQIVASGDAVQATLQFEPEARP